ncbi:MAG: hypothetical protein IJA11_05135 [Oscillospiraceae bacterium]|nr:hypothetical protein [Oscillospiraceae bacterium]
MSKEASSWSGTILGSSDYWEKLNHDTLFSDVTTRRPDYRMALTRLGHRASNAIDAIYNDLNELAGKIRFLPSEDRNALAKQVQSLYDVCKMGGVSAHRADDCIQGLSLSFMSPWSRDIPDPRAVEKAIEAIKLSPFSTRDRVALLLEAGHWGVNSAAGRDEKTRLLLQTIADLDHSSSFLTSVAEEYQQQTDPPRHEGRCGYEVGSHAYREHFEEQIFGRTLSGMFGTADYAALLREDLNSIARQLEHDLDDAQREGDYITDGTADILRDVVDDLDHCGASTMGLTGKIDKLAWYVGGDPAKIRDLQRSANDLDPTLHLEEDGVLGEETEHGISKITNRIAEFLTDPDKMRKLSRFFDLLHILEGIPKGRPILNWATHQLQERFAADIVRAIWKLGAEYYLRPKGYDVAALLLEHSLESSPSKLYFTQTHWVTQKVMESEAFSRGFSAVKELIRKNSSSYDNTGTFTVNFQETNETDLYYGIGKAEIKYACVHSPSKVYVAFVLEDTYDFDNFRVVYGDEGHYIILNIDPGPLANDAGLLSQANGVINTYDIHIRFSKTIDLEG